MPDLSRILAARQPLTFANLARGAQPLVMADLARATKRRAVLIAPDDSAGFNRFEASIAPPDVAPAPITV